MHAYSLKYFAVTIHHFLKVKDHLCHSNCVGGGVGIDSVYGWLNGTK